MTHIAPTMGTSHIEKLCGFGTIGLKKASVFPGFCEKHDGELFKSVETLSGSLSRMDVLLLTYRAICLELHKKQSVISIYGHPDFKMTAQRKGILNFVEGHLYGCRRAKCDLLRMKEKYLVLLGEPPGEEFHSIVFEFDHALPFAFSTAFAPEFDMFGTRILPHESNTWSGVSCFAGMIKGKCVLAFGGLHEFEHHDIARFFETAQALDVKKLGSIAFHFALEYSENTFFRPSWVNRLLPEIRNEILNRFGNGVPGQPNSKKEAIVSQFDIVRISGARQSAI